MLCQFVYEGLRGDQFYYVWWSIYALIGTISITLLVFTGILLFKKKKDQNDNHESEKQQNQSGE